MDIDEIKRLIVRQLLEQISKEEKKQLEEWLSLSEDNRILFHKLQSSAYIKKAVEDNNLLQRKAVWAKLEKQTLKKYATKLQIKWLKYAAVIALPLMIIGSALVWWGREIQTTETPIAQHVINAGKPQVIISLAGGEKIHIEKDTCMSRDLGGVLMENRVDTLNFVQLNDSIESKQAWHVIYIPRGGEYIARLQDGTVVHLNSLSELRIPAFFKNNQRTVWLKGEAYFQVTADKNRPFVVVTDKAEISVLGTEFNIRAYDEEQECSTTLVKGKVRVNSGDSFDILTPGLQAKISEKGNIITKKVNVYPYTAWINGRMVFENEPLEKIMDDLRRWYNFEVFYANASIKDIRFTIDIMKYDNIEKVMSLLEKTDKIHYSIDKKTLVLSK